MRIYTKESLILALKKICNGSWVLNARQGNAGGVGNTLEDLLGIPENNLPIPNAAEWELKCQRLGSGSLTTLFHMEPSPRALKFVPNILLPKYGWPHGLAGSTYPQNEMSFRQTIHGVSRSDRGFMVIIDRKSRKVLISFDANAIDDRHEVWRNNVASRIGLSEMNPEPYWGFDDLFHKAGTKLLNCFYILADAKKEQGKEYFRYSSILQLEAFSLDNFLTAIERADVLVDFDARTGHNHGTKFRLRQDKLPTLYSKVKKLL